MPTVDIRDAKTQLSRLIEQVASGEVVIITQAGKPVAKLVPADTPGTPKRFDFLKGHGKVPDDFDTIGQDDILKMFYGEE